MHISGDAKHLSCNSFIRLGYFMSSIFTLKSNADSSNQLICTATKCDVTVLSNSLFRIKYRWMFLTISL